MRIIALMNQKGGVGKTTTTVNLGAALAEQGKRVCLIDLDPQAHLTINYGVEPGDESHVSLYDVLVDDKSFLEAVHRVDQNVALVASSIDLAGAEIELVSKPGRETLLKRKLEAAQHDFDFILLDCPPSLGLLTINALSVADEVIIPMQPHFLALQGVAKLLETVHLVSQRINPKLKVGGVVLTMYDAQTKLTSEVVAELNGFIESAKGKPLPWSGAKVFSTKIRRNIKLAESPSFGQTILKYDSASNGAFDYRNLARELLGMQTVVAPARPAATTTAVTARPVTAAPPVAAPAMPPKPVMPAALVAAVKAKASTPTPAKPHVAPAAPVAQSSAPAPAPAKPVARPLPAAVTAPIPPLNLTPPPLPPPARPVARPAATAATVQRPPAKTQATPSPAPAPATAAPPAQPKPAVTVTVNPAVDQSKLAAATAKDNDDAAA